MAGEEQTDVAVSDAPQAGADAGTEIEAGADESQTSVAAESTGTDGEWNPSWRQEQAARRSGLSDEDVRGLVEAWGPERAAQFLDQRAEQHDAISREAIGFAAKPDAKPSEPDADAADLTVPDGEFALSPELYDETWEQPEAVARFFKPVQDEVNQLRKVVRTLSAQVRDTGNQTLAMTADTFFASLGDEYKDLFGDGPTNMYSKAPEQQARRRVISSAEKIAEGFRRAGTPLHVSEALRRALSMEMGDAMQQKSRSRLQEKAKRRAAQVGMGPRGRRETKPRTREQRKERVLRGMDRILSGERYERSK